MMHNARVRSETVITLMAHNPFPKRTQANATAEIGVGIVAAIVRERLGWEFRKTPQESDFGVDGYIDIVTPDGYVTGKSLAVQIKTGPSYFAEQTPTGWRYRGDLKHINYYLNMSNKVIILVVDHITREAWWRLFEAYETDCSGNSWTLLIPNSNLLDFNTKSVLEVIAGPVIDYLPHLNEFWMLDNKVKQDSIICIQVQRFEVENHIVRPFAKIFERLSVSRAVIKSAMNKVDFLVDGYNDDARDLRDIKEVRDWIESAVNTVKYLAYFLVMDDWAQGINTVILCQCKAHRVNDQQVEIIHGTRIPLFVEQQFAWLNEFTEQHGLSENINREVSMRFADRVSRGF
jgi:hypothetical protein